MVIPWKIQWKLVILTHVALYRLWLFRNFFFKFVHFDICERAWFKSRVAPPPGSVAPIIAKKKMCLPNRFRVEILDQGRKGKKEEPESLPEIPWSARRLVQLLIPFLWRPFWFVPGLRPTKFFRTFQTMHKASLLAPLSKKNSASVSIYELHYMVETKQPEEGTFEEFAGPSTSAKDAIYITSGLAITWSTNWDMLCLNNTKWLDEQCSLSFHSLTLLSAISGHFKPLPVY